jgi:16S rRNA G966 N2-methylase RsmD
MILASSNKNDIVADFFCGSGTTSLVAAKHGRKFITCDESVRAVHTARARLSGTKSVFSMERDLTIKTEVATKSKKIKIKVVGDLLQLQTSLDVDFWEVDPAWDGKIFRSAVQAQRHVRSGEIPMELKIKIGGRVCIRLVTVEGKQFQLNI